MKSKLLLFSFLFSLIAGVCSTAKAQAVNATDSLALVDLYNSTNGPFWNNHRSWLTLKSVSTWYGVTVTGTRVTSLILQGDNLSGPLPFSIGNLTALAGLNLSGNKITGTIPSSIGSIITLVSLQLNNNKFTGSIPASIGGLKLLGYLDLSNNQLSGAIPDSITTLTNLTNLRLVYNQLTGSIPAAIGNLALLTNLELYDNSLTGSIPASLTTLTKLVNLDANFNQLSGAIPNDIGNLDSLQNLILYTNQLSGSIPSSVGNLSNLITLVLSSNQLTGSIPGTVSKLSNLNELQFGYNNLSGSIPASIGNLNKLSLLALNHNQLSGTIPPSIGKLSNLGLIDISENGLTGFIPPSIIKLPVLTFLIAYRNQLTDSGNLSHLKRSFPLLNLSVGYNRFTFNTLQYAAQNIPHSAYTPQAPIAIHQHDDILAVSAGGTLSKNTYTWYVSGQTGGTVITGDSTYRPVQNGNYYATITNSIATQVILTTDTFMYASPLAKKEPAGSLSIYPNPVRGTLTINGLTTGSTYKIVVADVSGTVWLSTVARQQSTVNYNVSKLKPGNYVLNVSNGSTVTSLKLMKE